MVSPVSLKRVIGSYEGLKNRPKFSETVQYWVLSPLLPSETSRDQKKIKLMMNRIIDRIRVSMADFEGRELS